MSIDAAASGETPIDLAREPGFSLAELTIEPAALLVTKGGHSRTLEPRIMQVLVALARRRGEVVSRDALMQAGWGARVVGGDALYRAIMEVRRLGQESGAFSLENVRRVGYRLVENGPGATPPTGPPGPKRWPVLAVSAVLMAALVGATVWAWRAAADPHPGWQNGRVEVKTLQPASGDAGLQQVSSAFGDAMVRALASSGVETTLDPKTTDAEFRISGTVSRDGDVYATYAQIVDRRGAAVLWSKRFERNAADPAGFPESVANRVGDTLYCAMGSRSRSRKRFSPTVFAAFLNACADRRPPYRGADRFFEVTRRLTEMAPDLSVAYSMHAVAASVLAANADPKLAAGYFQTTKAAADRALQLDPQNGEADFAVGIAYGTGKAWLEREALFGKAAALAPDLSVVNNYQTAVLYETGRTAEADALVARNAGRDVFSPFVLRNLAVAQARQGDGPATEATLRRIDQMDPVTARRTRFEILISSDAPPATVVQELEFNGRGVVRDSRLECAKAFVRRMREARGPANGLTPACRSESLEQRIEMLARQGDLDGAFAIAPHAVAALNDTSFLFTPAMKRFRADPRFMGFAQDLGLVDYWRRSGHWPDFCAEPDRPYDCRAQSLRPTS